MRLPIRAILAILPIGFTIDAQASPDATPVIASVESTLGTSGKNIRQFAFDGDLETCFVSDRNPGDSDHFTMVLEKPVTIRSIEVTTGKSDGTDKLEGAQSSCRLTVKPSSKSRSSRTGSRSSSQGSAGPSDPDQARNRAEPAHPLVIREIKLDSTEPVATFQYPIEFTIDVADAPEMKEWAEKVARLCERWYPKLNEELKSDGYKPATQISLAIKSSYNGVAQASGTRITGSVKFFKEHPDDLAR